MCPENDAVSASIGGILHSAFAHFMYSKGNSTGL